jgi:GMP synthase-like glutamine amidotransferase
MWDCLLDAMAEFHGHPIGLEALRGRRAMAEPLVLVFQHIPIEHPGIFRDFLAADGLRYRAVELDAGESIPDLAGYDALWVMGGPMDVWEEERHPWLIAEKAAIREAVLERRMAFLGVCLGHQLLADALGGEVAPGQPEVGVLEIELTEAGRSSPLFEGLTARQPCLQWHGAEVRRPPEGAQVLARSAQSEVQAIQVGARAFGLQYHIEITPLTVAEWAEVPAYAEALRRTLGADALPAFEAQATAHMAEFNRVARRLYDNFMTVLRASA